MELNTVLYGRPFYSQEGYEHTLKKANFPGHLRQDVEECGKHYQRQVNSVINETYL